jgi:hypothetical protein
MAYGKIFESLFTGSLVGAGATVFATWAYVIANAKPPGVIEIHPKILATIIGCTTGEIEDAIRVLCSPDPASRTSDHEGRRMLIEGKFVYSLPTWEKYHSIRNEIERREQNRKAQATFRAKHGITYRKPESVKSAHADADADAVDNNKDGAPRSQETADLIQKVAGKLRDPR